MDFDERGYLTDPYRITFTSRVREVEDAGAGEVAVYLDTTYFYPVSGGQPDDRGTLGGRRIVSVTEDEKGVRHVVEGKLAAGGEIEGRIDWPRRFDHMQQHSGQHLLSRVFLEMLGARTVGFHLGERTCTIDLDVSAVSTADIERVELNANSLVWRSVPIGERVVSREEYDEIAAGGRVRGTGEGTRFAGEGTRGAGERTHDAAEKTHEASERMHGAGERTHDAREVRSRLPAGVDRVRIVEIEDVDRSTCCGTHCRTTAEIGIVKIIGTEKAKGNVRVEFMCGGRAQRDYGDKHALLARLASRFSTDWTQLERIVEKLSEEGRSLRKAYEAQERAIASLKAQALAEPTGKVGALDLVKRHFDDAPADSLREMALTIRDGRQAIILFGARGPKPALVFACSPGVRINMGDVMRESASIIGARGGGGKDLAQGGGGDGERIAEALDEAERRVREALA